MFGLWHWAGIQGVIRSYYRLNQSSDIADYAVGTLTATLAGKGVEAAVREYAINLAKRFRALGCDKPSAYVAAASAYMSEAFKLDPNRCEFAPLFIQDSLDNAEMLHPLAVVAVEKAKEEMLSVF